ncbi:MAG: bifunctional riboflavin kinase/FAD synthetase [Lachnospiraceae bacterium]|nr:bifunctional riboflavin kinase/FAD synthetase [Lachnospiraceae bacterium]MBP3507269.1 bifunctional riboflavin kinase/FAD synthetase [Lachnospiraceae bacterium]
MRHITDVKDIQLHDTAVALGKFDGFHRGHQLLIHQLMKWQEQGMTGVIFTFVPAGERIGSAKLIDSRTEKIHKAEKTGVNILLEYPFTKEFANLEPEAFVTEILIKQLDVRAVAIGKDFRFGKNRTGDAEVLIELGKKYGFQVQVFEKLKENQKEISSSAIRNAIMNGQMKLAASYMGENYCIYGEVVHGEGLGHTIGVPTTNQLISEEKLVPPFGVYAAKIIWKDQEYCGIANLGCKPTVSEGDVVDLETYIFDFQQDLYGEWIEVELLEFIRPEQKFETVEALLQQIEKDIEFTKLHF